jgi:Flp pilus assembly protein TadG
MRKAAYALVAFVAAALVIWCLAMAVYVTGSALRWWQDRDGGLAIGFAFTSGPFFALIGGVIASVMVLARVPS